MQYQITIADDKAIVECGEYQSYSYTEKQLKANIKWLRWGEKQTVFKIALKRLRKSQDAKTS